MKSYLAIFLIFAVVLFLSTIFYYSQFPFEADKVFLSISTFLFSIFTSFFVSRQASRFNKIREKVSEFGGKMSTIYRASGHVNTELQKKIGVIITAHYKKILTTGKWNIHYSEKSSTLTGIHDLLDEHVVDAEVTKVSNQALGAIVKSLAACQDVRKQVVTLTEERIPKEQWVLVLFFAAILISTVSTIESYNVIFASMLKSAFVVSVLSVIYILYKLNNLMYSEHIMGQRSAEDVIAIVEGNK
jgi:hypothetical protein